ncbi:MAG TPA: hypothetical protein PK626_00165 [Bacteroidales bacterium]|nr:hypothetical protein [Bacteroidales bacterium]
MNPQMAYSIVQFIHKNLEKDIQLSVEDTASLISKQFNLKYEESYKIASDLFYFVNSDFLMNLFKFKLNILK